VAGRGGWYKQYDDELDDPKIARLTDLQYRVWHVALAFCNRSPARLRERGYLYHSKDFPVEIGDFVRALAGQIETLARPNRAMKRLNSEVKAAIKWLCSGHGESSLMTVDGQNVYRIRAWRKRQRGDSEAEPEGEKSQITPTLLPKNPSLSPPYGDLDLDLDKDGKTAPLPPDQPTVEVVRDSPVWDEAVKTWEQVKCRVMFSEEAEKVFSILEGCYFNLEVFRKFTDWTQAEVIARGLERKKNVGRYWLAALPGWLKEQALGQKVAAREAELAEESEAEIKRKREKKCKEIEYLKETGGWAALSPFRQAKELAAAGLTGDTTSHPPGTDTMASQANPT